MKQFAALIILVMALAEAGHSQNVNWKALREDQRNIVQLNFGYDYGATAQVGYNRFFTLLRPVLVGIDYSMPMGNRLTDDFKVRLGGQIEVVELGNFSATVKIMSNFRRYQNDLVRILSFGSDFSLVTGYYRSTWHAAGEIGFDKAITSHLKHSDIMKSDFPSIKDGWYVPTGGNWYYGIQAGKTIGETFDLTLRLGATSAQNHDENPVLPYYLQLGLGVKF